MIALTAKRSQGFSLIELMVAMVLGLVLMGGVIQVFLTSKQSYSYNEELGWIQENARFALEYMTRDVRMAGYFGCSTSTPVVNTLNPVAGTGWQTAFGNGIGGYDGDDSANLAFSSGEFPQPPRPAVTSGTVPRSDVIYISRLDNSLSFAVSAHVASSATITADGHTFDTGDIIVITDCTQSAVFQHQGGNPGKLVHSKGNATYPGNCTKGLGAPLLCNALGNPYTYGDDASVMRAVSYAYYVDTASNGLPALYVRELGNSTATSSNELVQGIENLQVLYGLDTSGTPDGFANRYVSANSVADWTRVVTSRIYILSRSLTESASEPQTFSFMGTNYTPSDRYLRQEFVSTIQIRNRG